MQYSDYQNLVSSEKITLAIVSASKRLMGWELHSGSIYKLQNFTYPVIASVEDSGNAYTSVGSIGAVTASKYYLDRSDNTLYLRTTGSDNPNGRFIVVVVNLNFSNVPITLPHDLDSGFDVFWEPLVKSTSEFGVNIDTIAQSSEAIEGSGTLNLINDFVFWPANYDKLSFDNQRVLLYSYYRGLDVSEARLIFKGKVDTQAYNKDSITFQLKDQFAELRAPIVLPTIGALGARTGADLALASQRAIYGRVFGNVPTNIDQVLDGYPITGTVAIGVSGTTVTGTATAFLTEFSPDDTIVLSGKEYTVATVTSNTSLTITDTYTGAVISGVSTLLKPARPKRHMNRIFKVAGHALREATTTTMASSRIDRLTVGSNRDIYSGDTLYIGDLGSGELVVVDEPIGQTYIKLATSMAEIPLPGTAVLRPAVQNVRIDGVTLDYYADYTFDAEMAELTLSTDAESNAAPIFTLGTTVTFASGSRTVTGTGFQANIQPGYMIGKQGTSEFFEVLSVDSDTSLQLRSNSTIVGSGVGQFKSLIYDPDNSVLTLDCLGRTDDGTVEGILLKTAPAISKALLEDAGLAGEIDDDSFEAAQDIAYQELGFVIPATYSSTTAEKYRDVLNFVNKSVFGAIVQDVDFKFAYQVLQPNKALTAKRFYESDVLSFTLKTTAENVVKTCLIEYRPMEYDYTTNKASVKTSQNTSDIATYILKTDRSKTISTVLVNQSDASIMAARWSFITQNSSGRLSFTTKLQGATLEIGDIIDLEHRKFFERFGSTGKRKLLLVEAVYKSGSSVRIEATDLSNTFNRVACINEYENDWTSASEEERLYGGYITDQYGLINNDPISFETNLIW